MSPDIVSMPLAELVEDLDLYPRHAVDSSNVQSLVFALESGATLPPIVADKKSKRIIDGMHRRRAYHRVVGASAVVDVELIPYEDESAMIFDAVARNAQHGRPFDAIDKTRSVIMLRKVGFDDGQISLAMKMPSERVQKLAVKVAKAPKSSEETVPGTTTITLKRSASHMAGKSMTKAQAKAHAMMPGTSLLLVAKQLTAAIEAELVNMEDKKLVNALGKLKDLLNAKVP